MTNIRPLRLIRRRRLRLRRLCRVDVPALTWLQRCRRVRTVEPLGDPDSLRALIDKASQYQLSIELDHQLVGALTAAPTAWACDPAEQPWGLLDDGPPTPSVDRDGSVLCDHGAFWADLLSDEEIGRLLTVGRKALVQQLGLEATVSVVAAQGWSTWSEQMAPQAYLQQVHAGGIEDPAVSLLLDNGWAMRGFWQVGEALQVVMWWQNRAR